MQLEKHSKTQAFNEPKKGTKMEKKSVVVTTEFRGVFFGEVKNDKKLPSEITLINARNCIYWSSDVGGFLGLAAKGPSSSCKIGAIVPELTVYKITSISPVSQEVAEKWKKI